VRCERLESADGAQIRARSPSPPALGDTVAAVIARVRAEGDAAVLDCTRRWDTAGAEPRPLRVAAGELEAALAALAGGVRAGLELALANVAAVARAGRARARDVELPQGQRVRTREVPVGRAGAYVPGGRAPYPSTVVMCAATAATAGVGSVAVCAPPRPDGDAHPAILAACELAGAREVYRMGGAQAVAALAYGTETVAPVDVIVGPGNAYVTEAKRQVFGQVGIDGLAGPSDVLVVAAADADPAACALDLLAQAEHGPGTIVALASPAPALLDAVAARVREAPDSGATCVLTRTGDLEEALALAEDFAPEHLELLGAGAEALAGRVRHAGCVFVGTGTAFGDYVAGSNHVLPTGGAARWASALSAGAFMRRVTEVRVPPSAAAALAPAGAVVARAEGFELHARSMEARMEPS
jgi:histidinol dehydrogenase